VLVAGLGVMFILLGLGFLGILKRLDERGPAVMAPVEPVPPAQPIEPAPTPAT
jgi:hypothetical protein